MHILALHFHICFWWHTPTSSLQSRLRVTHREFLVLNFTRVQGRWSPAFRLCFIRGEGSTYEPQCMWLREIWLKFGSNVEVVSENFSDWYGAGVSEWLDGIQMCGNLIELFALLAFVEVWCWFIAFGYYCRRRRVCICICLYILFRLTMPIWIQIFIFLCCSILWFLTSGKQRGVHFIEIG